MNEDIKEIDIKKCFYLCVPLLNKECTKENCYINNGGCCHTVNEKYSQEHLLSYITNLQEENNFLKLNNPEMNIEHFRIVKENKRKIDNLRKENQKLVNVIEELKKHICSEWYCFDNESVEFEVAKNILNKLTELKGGSDEK